MPFSNPALMRPPYGFGRGAAGFGAAAAIAAILTTAFWSIQSLALGARPGLAIDIAHLLRMTALQAGLTTILSLIVGTALAWALNRLSFPGRGLVTGFFAAAIVTPGLVVALGLLTVWGRAGWANALLQPFGIDLGSAIFGLQGILLAHVILDATFAARILLGRLDAIPATPLKTGQSLGLGPWQRFGVIDWPAIAGAMPGLGAIIFLMAFTSFPIVLLLGGGPANQTLEVAIYAEVRQNFNLGNAVHLALIQLAVCAAIILPSLGFAPAVAPAGVARAYHWEESRAVKWLQIAVLIICVLGFALPLLAVLVHGFNENFIPAVSRASFWRAATTSFSVGVASAISSLVVATLLARGRAAVTGRFWRLLLTVPAYVILAVPAVVLALGFFLGIRNLGIAPQTAAAPVLVAGSTLLALPFAISTMAPAIEAIERRYRKLCRALGVTGLKRWRLVEWPLLGRETGIALALGFCLSLGELGIISLFGTEDFTTLPWQMYHAMGAYRSDDAGAIAAIVLVLCLGAFWLLPPLFERLSHAGD